MKGGSRKNRNSIDTIPGFLILRLNEGRFPKEPQFSGANFATFFPGLNEGRFPKEPQSAGPSMNNSGHEPQ